MGRFGKQVPKGFHKNRSNETGTEHHLPHSSTVQKWWFAEGMSESPGVSGLGVGTQDPSLPCLMNHFRVGLSCNYNKWIMEHTDHILFQWNVCLTFSTELKYFATSNSTKCNVVDPLVLCDHFPDATISRNDIGRCWLTFKAVIFNLFNSWHTDKVLKLSMNTSFLDNWKGTPWCWWQPKRHTVRPHSQWTYYGTPTDHLQHTIVPCHTRVENQCFRGFTDSRPLEP